LNRHSETRNEAYHDRSMERALQESLVLAYLKKIGHGSTIKEAAVALNLPDSTVSGRFNDLIRRGKVVIAPFSRKCRINGRRKNVYILAADSPQMMLRRTA
jgi:predicted ArsR family transcriptional regulator